jgi:hypothetical protein
LAPMSRVSMAAEARSSTTVRTQLGTKGRGLTKDRVQGKVHDIPHTNRWQSVKTTRSHKLGTWYNVSMYSSCQQAEPLTEGACCAGRRSALCCIVGVEFTLLCCIGGSVLVPRQSKGAGSHAGAAFRSCGDTVTAWDTYGQLIQCISVGALGALLASTLVVVATSRGHCRRQADTGSVISCRNSSGKGVAAAAVPAIKPCK